MTVPSRSEAAALLAAFDPPAWFAAHVTAVADVAGHLAERIEARGTPVDRHLVEAAALLHDLDKLLAATDPRAALPHGEGSAAWLAAHGMPELGEAVAAHPVTRLEAAHDALTDLSLEARIVAYADKRAGQHLEPMAARFATWARRHPTYTASLRAAWPHALELERAVCRLAGLQPGEVRRLRWAGDALAAARRQRRTSP